MIELGCKLKGIFLLYFFDGCFDSKLVNTWNRFKLILVIKL